MEPVDGKQVILECFEKMDYDAQEYALDNMDAMDFGLDDYEEPQF